MAILEICADPQLIWFPPFSSSSNHILIAAWFIKALQVGTNMSLFWQEKIIDKTRIKKD